MITSVHHSHAIPRTERGLIEWLTISAISFKVVKEVRGDCQTARQQLTLRIADPTFVHVVGASAAHDSYEDTIIVDAPVIRPQQASRNRERKGKQGRIVKAHYSGSRGESRFKPSQLESRRTSAFGWISAKLEMVWRHFF
jgi:hypothetical protein